MEAATSSFFCSAQREYFSTTSVFGNLGIGGGGGGGGGGEGEGRWEEEEEEEEEGLEEEEKGRVEGGNLVTSPNFVHDVHQYNL